MTHRSPTLALAFLAVFLPHFLAPSVRAQGRTWIVDASNGPGAHFTTLQAGFDGATPGDLVRVRTGLYGGAVLRKGLTVLCDRAVYVDEFTDALTVTSVPFGQQVVIEGLLTQFAAVIVRVSNCQGRVLIDRCSSARATGLVIEGCRQVQVNRCTLGAIPLQVTDSTVAISDTQMVGASQVYQVLAGAVIAARSELVISRGSITGMYPQQSNFAPAPAIYADNCKVVIVGDLGTTLKAGPQGTGQTPAIRTNGGTLILDPNVRLVPFGGAPPIAGTAAVTITRLPSLSVVPAAPGNVLNANLFSPAGDLVLFVTSLAANRVSVVPEGDFWFDPGFFVLVGLGVQGGSEHFDNAIALPNDPAIVFAAWVQQAISGTVAGGWKLSNPSCYALN